MPDDPNDDVRRDTAESDQSGSETREASALDAARADDPPTQILDHGGFRISPDGSDGDAEGATQILETPANASGGRRVGLIGLVGAAAIALVAAGGVYAYSLLSGGGAQPEEFVPANALAYAKLDLDPSAGQKLQALRFFRHFPDADAFLGDEDDVRKIFFEYVQENDDALAALDFDEDIAPWLGDRIGFAALPSDDGREPVGLVVLQVRDEQRARDGLSELFHATNEQLPGVAFARGYALLAEDEQTAIAALDAAAETSLADDETFSSDMAELGDGVAASWVDVAGLIDQLGVAADPALSGLPMDLPESRFATVVSFDDSYVDLTFKVFGAPDTQLLGSAPAGELLRSVPSDTLVAVAASGLGPALLEAWPDLVPTLTFEAGLGPAVTNFLLTLDRDYGLTAGADFPVVLGDRTLFVVAGNTLYSTPPLIGLRSDTDTGAVEDVMVGIERALADVGFPISWDTDETTLYVGLSPDDLSAMQSGTGIADPAAETALPGLDTAQFALWVDLDAISEIVAEESGADPVRDVLDHFAGIGVIASIDDEGIATATVRVVVD